MRRSCFKLYWNGFKLAESVLFQKEMQILAILLLFQNAANHTEDHYGHPHTHRPGIISALILFVCQANVVVLNWRENTTFAEIPTLHSPLLPSALSRYIRTILICMQLSNWRFVKENNVCTWGNGLHQTQLLGKTILRHYDWSHAAIPLILATDYQIISEGWQKCHIT